jgi:adenylate kinase family enzyme
MRVAILGNSGSGKSTLAKKLSGDSSLPLLDLDTIYWRPGQVAIERKTLDREADLRRFCSDHDQWVIEGCYADLIETSFPWRPELVLLHPGLEVCVQNCRDGHTRLTSTPQKRSKIGD